MLRINAIETAAVAVFAVVVFALWGPNQHYGHAYSVAIGAAMLVFFAVPSIPVQAFGVMLAIWTAWILSMCWHDLIPIELTGHLCDQLLLLISGAGFGLVALYGRRDADFWFFWLRIITILLAIAGLYQVFFAEDLPAVATLGNQNFLAAWLAVALPFFGGPWLFAVPIVAGCLVAAQTSTALAAAAVAIAWQRYGLRGVLAGVVVAALYYQFIDTGRGSTGERFDLWLDCWRIATSSPWIFFFGVGPGVQWAPGNMLHSEYFYALYNYGIVGLGLFCWAAVDILRRDIDRRLKAASIAVFVDCIGNHLFHTGPTAVLSAIVIGLALREPSWRIIR